MEDENELDSTFKEIKCDFDLTPFPDEELQFNEEDYKIFNKIKYDENFVEENNYTFYNKYMDENVVFLSKNILNLVKDYYVEVTKRSDEIVHQKYQYLGVTKEFEKYDKEITKRIETETLEITIYQENEHSDIVNKFVYGHGHFFADCIKKPDGTIIKSYYDNKSHSTLIRTKTSNGMVIYSSRREW